MDFSKVTQGMKSGAKLLVRSTFRAIASFPWSRRLLNAVYLKLTASQRAFFHQAFAKTFRNSNIQARDGTWKVIFASRSILMPLSSGNFWLDWDNAVSIVGHDIEVKQTYETLLGLPSLKPELFIDIGANYGTHSLLFLAHGIRAITFEPNTSCHDYFRQICKLNHVNPKLEPVALGDREGCVDFSYPQRDTWLGSTNSEIISKLSQREDLVTKKVEQKTLDSYSAEIAHKRTLIKIDTEGNELSVLKGAAKTLKEVKPMIIFECFGDNERTKLFGFLISQNNSIYRLPWNPEDKAESLTACQFLASASTNFIAIPLSVH